MGDWMRTLLFLVVMSLLLAGCMGTDRQMPGREPFYRTAETAQNLGLVTPEIARECSARVTSEMSGVRIVGSYSVSAYAAFRNKPVTLLPTDENNNLVALMAPAMSQGPFGELKVMAGCLYRLRDNRLAFEKASIFGSRIDLERAKPGNT